MKSVFKNYIYNILYQILLIILPLITAPYISRKLGATALGIYSYTNSIAYYFVSFCLLGMANHGSRSIAAVREDKDKLSKTFWELYFAQLLLSVISVTSYIAYCLFIVKENKTIAILQLLYVISGMFDISWLFFGLEKFKITVLRNSLIKITTVILIFIFVKTPSDLGRYTIILSGGLLLSQLYLWSYVKKIVCICKISIKNSLKHLKPLIILYIPVLSYSIYKIMDKIMIGLISTYFDVGIYQNAEKIVNIPMGLITALGTVMLPKISNLVASGDSNKINSYIEMSIKFMTIICSAFAFGLMGISDNFSIFYLGKEFANCGGIIKLLSISTFFVAWASVIRNEFLIPYHKDSIYLISTGAGAILNFFINFLMIPKLGAYGAAIGTIVAEASVMIIQCFMTRKNIHTFKYIIEYYTIVLFGVVMYIIVYGIGRYLDINLYTILIQITIGVVIFTALAIVFVLLKRDFIYKYMCTVLSKLSRKSNM